MTLFKPGDKVIIEGFRCAHGLHGTVSSLFERNGIVWARVLAVPTNRFLYMNYAAGEKKGILEAFKTKLILIDAPTGHLIEDTPSNRDSTPPRIFSSKDDLWVEKYFQDKIELERP